MALREKVIFDTNFLFNKKATSFFGNREELEQFSKVADIIVPEIVIEELEGKYERSFGQEKVKFLNTLLPSILDHNVEVVDINTRIKELKDAEDISYQVIQLTDFNILPEIKKLAIKKQPPFEPGDGTDKGFKDTYIYFTVLEYLQQIPDKYVFICVKDKRFKKAFESHHNIYAIESYDEFLRHRISQFQDDYFLSKINEELGIEFYKEDVLDYWMNINDNQVLLIKNKEEEFVCEVDSREIIAVAKTEDYQNSIKNLINSADFLMTNSSIEILDNHINFLSEEEAKRILEASFHNTNIRWVINEHDIKLFIGTLYEMNDDVVDGEIKEFLDDIFE